MQQSVADAAHFLLVNKFNETTGICHLHQFDKKQNKSYNFSEPSVKAKIIALKEKKINHSFCNVIKTRHTAE